MSKQHWVMLVQVEPNDRERTVYYLGEHETWERASSVAHGWVHSQRRFNTRMDDGRVASIYDYDIQAVNMVPPAPFEERYQDPEPQPEPDPHYYILMRLEALEAHVTEIKQAWRPSR